MKLYLGNGVLQKAAHDVGHEVMDLDFAVGP